MSYSQFRCHMDFIYDMDLRNHQTFESGGLAGIGPCRRFPCAVLRTSPAALTTAVVQRNSQ